MKATINSHGLNTEDGLAPYCYFAFTIEGGDVAPYADFVSLRTARMLVGELWDDNALLRMLFAIVNADASEHDSLIGRVFED